MKRDVKAVALLVLAMVGGLGGCAGPQEEEAPPEPELLPGGYQMALDGDRVDPGHFVIDETPDGVRFTTGPGGIAWRPADIVAAGDYRAEATLIQMGAPVGYREGFGIFAGGRSLEGGAPSYLYLLVRATGEFLVRRRTPQGVETLVDWTSHAAVQRIAADGDDPTNTLAIQVRGDETQFLVNGTVVFILTDAAARPYGTAGLRVNHRLDLVLTSWSLGPPPPPEEAATP